MPVYSCTWNYLAEKFAHRSLSHTHTSHFPHFTFVYDDFNLIASIRKPFQVAIIQKYENAWYEKQFPVWRCE